MGSSSAELSAAMGEAATSYLARCVVPLIGDHEGPTTLYGCGTLFADGSGHYLVTATHVLEDVPNAQLGIPVGEGNSEVWTISGTRIAKSPIGGEDVAVVELEASILTRLATVGYRTFLAPQDVANTEPSTCIAFGYRLEDLVTTETSIGAIPTLISARAYAGRTDNVRDVKIGRHDVLLDWQHDLSLRGISGSPLWTTTAPGEGAWTSQHALKLIGVQTGAVAKTWIRGTRWAVVTQLIGRLVASREK